MNSNRSSNQSQGKAKGKNRPTTSLPKIGKKDRTMKTRAPSAFGVAAAYAQHQTTKGPKVIRTDADSCRIVHRELIASVTGTVAFTVAQSFPLNPGIATSFPWLSNEALGWERYRFNRLRFCYYTRTGTGVPGSVMMAPDYDAADPAPASEQAASSYHDCEEDAPWKDIVCTLSPKDLNGAEKEKYVRSGALAANQDIKTFDSGNLHLCTVDGTAVSWGKLWVEYDVTLFTPQVPPGGFPGVGMLTAAGGSIAAATPFGAVPVSSGQFSLAGAATNVVSFQNLTVGQAYDIRALIVGTVITGISTGTAVGGTLSLQRSNAFNAAATNGMCSALWTATAASGSFVLTVTATTVTVATLLMTTQPLGSGEA